MCANADQMVVVLGPRPACPALLLDTYLVAAHAHALAPVLVFNKCDLPPDAAEAGPPWVRRADLAVYAALGVTVVEASTIDGRGLDALADALAGRTSIMVGQSGVGKSSLLNALRPAGARARVGAITEAPPPHPAPRTRSPRSAARRELSAKRCLRLPQTPARTP